MFTEDLAEFFLTDDFAVSARYDGKLDVPAIFDREFLQQVGSVAGRGPSALVRSADVDTDPTGKTLVIAGTSYTIRGIEPIDDGATAVVRLETT